jgi:hypothetical protein
MNRLSNILIFVFFILLFNNLNAQWNSNTNVNTTICDTTGEQSLTKIAVCPDGSSYITWFDHRTSNYDVYIQRLNTNGVRQFGNNGLLVSNNLQNSSLVDYDLIADDSGNAIVTFTDIRNGGQINPFAYKISPAGTFLWGANGVTLSDSINSYQPNPHVVKTSDGNFVFVWRLGSGPTKIAMQKLNTSGVKQWGTGPIIITSGTTENYDWCSHIATDNGSIIMLWSGYTGTFLSPQNYRLYSQKFSSTGTRVWNSTQDTVYNLGKVSGFYTPRIFPDGNSGAIYVWQDDRNVTSQMYSYAQRKSSTGTLLFQVNGAPVGASSNCWQLAPMATSIPSTGETFVFWQHKNTLQSMIGVYGQKLSATGSKMWADTGVAFKPMDANSFANLYAFAKDTNIFVSYLETITGGTNCLIKAFKPLRNGTLDWSGSLLTPGSSVNEKLKLSSGVINTGMSILTWSDKRSDGGNIYAQNINLNGTFGPPSGIVPVNESVPNEFKLFQNYPNPFNSMTNVKWQMLNAGDAEITVFDLLGKEVAVLMNENLQPGTYQITFDAGNLSSGVYYYTLTTNDFSSTKAMILLK